MRQQFVRAAVFTTIVCLSIAGSPATCQEQEEDRGWQEILGDVVRDAVQQGTSSTRLGRVRDIDVVSRSGEMVELEVRLQDISEPDRVRLTADVFDQDHEVIGGFDSTHDPIEEGDGTVLLRVYYSGAEDARSVIVKVNLVDAETGAVATLRKAPLPWEWTGRGGGGYASGGGSVAGPGGLSTRGGGDSWVEDREPRIVELQPRRVGNTPRMGQSASGGSTDTSRPQTAHAPPPPPTLSSSASPSSRGGASSRPAPAPPPPPTSSSSSATSGRGGSAPRPASPPPPSGASQPTYTGVNTAAASAIAKGSIIMASVVDLYIQAKEATWKSGTGSLKFNDKPSGTKGYVRAMDRGTLTDGKSYSNVLETRPERKANGYISGTYDVAIPASAKTFEATVGFLASSKRSDGVMYSVTVKSDGKTHVLRRMTVSPRDGVQKVRLEIPEDVRGKNATVVLAVNAGRTYTQDDSFAWSAPTIR